jgi:thymidylate synthase (FAD)
MKLIKPSYEIIPQAPGLEGIYKQIELAGRVCYKSEDKITEDSSKNFTDIMIKSGHGAMLEHGTVYLKVPINIDEAANFIDDNFMWTKYHLVQEKTGNWWAITTNYRRIIECNLEYTLKYLCEPTKYHEKRVTVKFITDIGCGREILRHRVFSYANESTRYCNYSKDKFGNEITFITPHWFKNVNTNIDIINDDLKELSYKNYLKQCENLYLDLIKYDSPQNIRGILPLCTKSELVVTGFVSDWKHFFDLRTDIAKTGKPHPDLLQVTNPLYEEFKNKQLIC